MQFDVIMFRILFRSVEEIIVRIEIGLLVFLVADHILNYFSVICAHYQRFLTILNSMQYKAPVIILNER